MGVIPRFSGVGVAKNGDKFAGWKELFELLIHSVIKCVILQFLPEREFSLSLEKNNCRI